MKKIKNQYYIDATGLRCPMPVLKAQKFLSDCVAGDHLKLETTDPASYKDIPAFCRESGHRLLSATDSGETFVFVIEAASKD